LPVGNGNDMAMELAVSLVACEVISASGAPTASS